MRDLRGGGHNVADFAAACILAALLLAPLPLVAQAVGAAVLIGVSRRPSAMLLGGILVLPLSGGKLTTIGLFTVVCVGVAALSWSTREPGRPRAGVWALAGLALWITVSFVALQRQVSFGQPTVSDLVQPLAGIIVAVLAAWFPPVLRNISRMSILVATVVALVVLNSPPDIYGRVGTLNLNPNSIAALITLLMAGCLIGAGRWEALATCIAWTLGMLALVRTESRAGLLALGVAIAVRMVLSERGVGVDWRRGLAALAAFSMLVAAAPHVIDFLQQRYFGTRDLSALSSDDLQRGVALSASIRVAVDNPVAGVGYGNFAAVAAGLPSVHEYLATHDEYTELAAELGALGVALFLWPLASAVRRVLGTPRTTLLPALFCLLTSLAFGNDLGSFATSYLFWLVLGSCLAGRAADQPTKDPTTKGHQTVGRRSNGYAWPTTVTTIREVGANPAA